MINVLCIEEYWHDLNPESGRISPTTYLISGVLDNASFVNKVNWYYDDEIYKFGMEQAITNLWDIISTNTFDVVVLSLVHMRVNHNIDFNLIHELKSILGIPFVFMWFDSYWADGDVSNNIMGLFRPIADLNLYLDSPFYMDPKSNNMFIPWYNDQIYTSDSSIIKDIEIGFFGSSNREKRQEILHLLKINNLEVTTSGGFNTDYNDIKEYVKLYQRAKISLNISDDPTRLKGRIYESMLCGAMLIEDYNRATQIWFEPNKHYIMYEDECDLIDKIEYYLEHDSERERIAQAGYERAKELCDANTFWNNVFSVVKINKEVIN